MKETGLDWITFSTPNQIPRLDRLKASSTFLIRRISNSKHYPADKPPNEISSLKSTDMVQT